MLLLINSKMPVNKIFQKSKAAQVVINVHVCTQKYTIYPNGNIIIQCSSSHPNSFKYTKKRLGQSKLHKMMRLLIALYFVSVLNNWVTHDMSKHISLLIVLICVRNLNVIVLIFIISCRVY